MTDQIKKFVKGCNGDDLTRTELSLLVELNNLRNELEILREKAADDSNWRGVVTNALVGPGSEDISIGRALELIAGLRKGIQ
jgi:hypothetical protein